MDVVYNLIWTEYFWIPTGMTWDIWESNDPGVYYPKFRDLFPHSLVVGLLLLFLRLLLDRYALNIVFLCNWHGVTLIVIASQAVLRC